MKHLIGLVTATGLLIGCGVEAGNPGTSKPDTKKGGVSIRFATQFDLNSPTLSLNLSAFNLNRDDEEFAKIIPNVQSINLFAKNPNDEQLVAESEDIPTGFYNGIVVALSSDQPVLYRDSAGQERMIDNSDPSATAFQIDEDFEVSDSQKTEIVLNIDPYRSLIKQDGDNKKFKFHPKGHSHRRGRGLIYDGVTTVIGAEWVCAYAFNAKKFEKHRDRSGPKDKEEKLRSKRILADRKVFDRKEEIIKDDNSSCINAFAVAPVTNGEYHLRQLVPATYLLRFFKADGSYEDSSDPVRLRPWRQDIETEYERRR